MKPNMFPNGTEKRGGTGSRPGRNLTLSRLGDRNGQRWPWTTPSQCPMEPNIQMNIPEELTRHVALVLFGRWWATRRLGRTATAPSRAWPSPTCRWSCAPWARRWRWRCWGGSTPPWWSRNLSSSPNLRGPGCRRSPRAKPEQNPQPLTSRR